MRPHVSNIPEAFEAFARELEKRKRDVALIAEARNGFEGWLKAEWYRWLRERHELSLDDIGMEYRLNKGARGHYEKRCDPWIRASDDDRWHFVELKVPFANGNKGKMLRFGGDDLWHMMNIAAEREGAASGGAILVGVHFTGDEWVDGRRLVRRAAGLDADAEPERHGVICGTLHRDVWTHRRYT